MTHVDNTKLKHYPIVKQLSSQLKINKFKLKKKKIYSSESLSCSAVQYTKLPMQ